MSTRYFFSAQTLKFIMPVRVSYSFKSCTSTFSNIMSVSIWFLHHGHVSRARLHDLSTPAFLNGMILCCWPLCFVTDPEISLVLAHERTVTLPIPQCDSMESYQTLLTVLWGHTGPFAYCSAWIYTLSGVRVMIRWSSPLFQRVPSASLTWSLFSLPSWSPWSNNIHIWVPLPVLC